MPGHLSGHGAEKLYSSSKESFSHQCDQLKRGHENSTVEYSLQGGETTDRRPHVDDRHH